MHITVFLRQIELLLSYFIKSELKIVQMIIENLKPENLLKVSQIAELLGVSKTTVRAILNNGTIPYIRIGGRNRVLKADLENYLFTNTYRQDLKPDAE